MAKIKFIKSSRLKKSKIEYGDFNGDGYSDLLYSGVQTGSGKISELREFDPTSENYIKHF